MVARSRHARGPITANESANVGQAALCSETAESHSHTPMTVFMHCPWVRLSNSQVDNDEPRDITTAARHFSSSGHAATLP